MTCPRDSITRANTFITRRCNAISIAFYRITSPCDSGAPYRSFITRPCAFITRPRDSITRACDGIPPPRVRSTGACDAIPGGRVLSAYPRDGITRRYCMQSSPSPRSARPCATTRRFRHAFKLPRQQGAPGAVGDTVFHYRPAPQQLSRK